jgi:DNA-binding NarL/FixJ family response regulator
MAPPFDSGAADGGESLAPGILASMQAAACTRVFIVDDSPPIRERLIELLAGDAVTVVGEAETPGDAIAGIRRTRPDCVVLDLKLIGGSGIEVLHSLRPEFPDTTFIVLSNHSDVPYRRSCEAAGASFFLDKTTEFGKIASLIAGLPPVKT